MTPSARPGPSGAAPDPTPAPLATPLRADVEVVEQRLEGDADRRFGRIVLRVPDWPGFGPGQFAMLSPGSRGAAPRWDPLLPRPMAIYRVHPDSASPGGADPQEGAARVEVLYQVSGRGTALLAEAKVGERVGWVGPLGQAFALPEPGERALLVGGGTGIASLYELAARIGAAATVLLGARSASGLMGREDFEALASGLRIATEDGSEGHAGRVTELLEAELAEAGPARVYACGPTPMMQRAAEIAAAAGAPCVASLENAMACGFGVCLGCAAPLADGGFALVCRDGPMFDASRVAWKGLP